MGLAQPIERRFQGRHIINKLPGDVVERQSGKKLECQPLDASDFGFSVFIEDHLPDCDHFVLEVNDQKIDLELVYDIESPGDKWGFRLGFRVVDPNIKLLDIFTKEGCY